MLATTLGARYVNTEKQNRPLTLSMLNSMQRKRRFDITTSNEFVPRRNLVESYNPHNQSMSSLKKDDLQIKEFEN